MTLYFHSPNEFPLDTVSIIGLSAKLSDDSIGRFGTGMKYAIAIILRLGGSIVLERDGERYLFETRTATLRDKTYQQIWMLEPSGRETLLPFTLDYGRDWEDWQAYRELFSNCLDEGGDVSRQPVSARTVFIVEGLDAVHEKHDTIFLPRKRQPIAANADFELCPGSSQFLYYRGIRVYGLPRATELTINILRRVSLTEDRTLTFASGVLNELASSVAQSTDPDLIRAAVTHENLDEVLHYAYISNASDIFVSNVERLRDAKPYAQLLARTVRKDKEGLKSVTPTLAQEARIKSSIAFLSGLVPRLCREDVRIAEDIGSALGVYATKEDRIYLSQGLFTMSRSEFNTVLLEEAIHKYERYGDETRAMQTYLMRALVASHENYLDALA